MAPDLDATSVHPVTVPGAPVGRWRSAGLERRLFLVALLALLPLALLSFAGLYQMGLNQRQQLLDSAQGTMRAVATAIDGELRMTSAALQALALSPRLAQGDLEGFRVEAAALLRQRAEWSNIVLSDVHAQQQLNLQLPAGMPLPRRVDAPSVERTVRTGEPQIGGLVFSPVLKEYAVAVLVPVFDEHRRVSRVLTAVVRPTAIRDLVLRQRIPKNGVVGVMDRQDHFVTRSLEHDQWIGQLPVPPLRAALARGTEGALRASTLEGRAVYSVYQRLPESGWSVAVGIPVEVIDGPIRLAFLVFGGFLLLSVALGIVGATVLARTITRPMAALTSAAEQLGRGETPRLPASSLPEVASIGRALAQAHREREALLVSERHARRAAEQANRHKDEFLAMLGHELRNPLAALGAASALLEAATEQREPALADRARAVIRRQIQHLTRLADDLLDAGRAIVGKLQLYPERLALAALVRNVVATFTDTGSLRQHHVRLALQPAWVMGDPTRLEQAVSNLLANAIKYTPPGGTLDVTLTAGSEGAQLSVSDTGIGLDAELLPRVFDLFVQGERSLARSEGGLGLGLTLVRRIVELHGGEVTAHSEGVGRGSRFTLTLPLAAAAVAPPPVAAPHRRGVPCKLVLVEDNADLRDGLCTLLELQGHAVQGAADGPEGVTLILREHPQVALIDIGLPGFDGWEVARRVRAATAQPPLLVALSGYDEAQADPSQRSAFDAYLIKPVRLGELEALLATVDCEAAAAAPRGA